MLDPFPSRRRFRPPASHRCPEPSFVFRRGRCSFWRIKYILERNHPPLFSPSPLMIQSSFGPRYPVSLCIRHFLFFQPSFKTISRALQMNRTFFSFPFLPYNVKEEKHLRNVPRARSSQFRKREKKQTKFRICLQKSPTLPGGARASVEKHPHASLITRAFSFPPFSFRSAFPATSNVTSHVPPPNPEEHRWDASPPSPRLPPIDAPFERTLRCPCSVPSL